MSILSNIRSFLSKVDWFAVRCVFGFIIAAACISALFVASSGKKNDDYSLEKEKQRREGYIDIIQNQNKIIDLYKQYSNLLEKERDSLIRNNKK